MNQVHATIVTYNRLELLRQCLTAVLAQTCRPDHVLVVNNASTDGTREYLDAWAAEDSNLRSVVHLPTNTGGSGGFTHALKQAYVGGAEWTWVMDDDSLPEIDCLQKLLEHKNLPDVGFLAPIVRWKDGSPCLSNPTQANAVHWADRFSDNEPLVRILSASFVGLLIHKRSIQKTGFPVPQFFIWYDDIEYTLRITRELPAYCVATANVRHMIPENASPGFSKVNEHNLWKHQYGIRNETAVTIATRRFGLARAFLLWLQRNKEMKSGRVPARLRFAVLRWGVRGLTFNYLSRIERPS